MKKSFDLFYSTTPELTLGDWEQIVHALITYGNSVWLRSDIPFGRNIEADRIKKLERTRTELIEEGAIATWDLEITRQDNGCSARTVSLEEHKDLYGAINEIIVTPSNEAEETLLGRDIKSVTKLVEARQELWNLGIANLCKSQGIVYGSAQSIYHAPSTLYRYEKINKKYTQVLFRKFDVPSVSGLSTQSILDIRKRAGALRRTIDEMLKAKMIDIGIPDSEIMKDCGQAYSEYLATLRDIIGEKSGEGFWRRRVEDIMVRGAGFILPIDKTLGFAKKLVDWLHHRHQYRFFLYMLELQKKPRDE